jgi:formylglycine-generating enzyme required for sulfatase activity
MEDCWHWSYEGHPSDGSAWTTGECPGHVVRGGVWAGTPGIIRAADRYFTQNGGRGNDVGFRLAIDVR